MFSKLIRRKKDRFIYFLFLYCFVLFGGNVREEIRTIIAEKKKKVHQRQRFKINVPFPPPTSPNGHFQSPRRRQTTYPGNRSKVEPKPPLRIVNVSRFNREKDRMGVAAEFTHLTGNISARSIHPRGAVPNDDINRVNR